MTGRVECPPSPDPEAVAVRELTVAEIRAWIKDPFSGAEPDVVGALLLSDTGLTLGDLQRFTDLDAAAVEAMTPTQLRRVADRVKEINADFFALLGSAAGLAPRPNPLPEPSAD